MSAIVGALLASLDALWLCPCTLPTWLVGCIPIIGANAAFWGGTDIIGGALIGGLTGLGDVIEGLCAALAI